MTTRSHASTTRQTSYTFDKLGRVTAVDNPSPMGDEEVGYDNYGNQLWKEDGKGIVTLYKYDTLNRVTDVYYNYTGSLTTISYPGTADVSYTYYGGSGIRAKVVDSAGTSKYAYNVLRQMTTYTASQPSNRSISYTYNNLGQKTSAGYGGMTINYEYFANGWLKAVKKGANTVASYSYDTSGNRTRVDFGNGTYQVFDYDSDPRYRLASIDYAYGCEDDEDIEVRGTLDVTRDKTGNPLTWGNDDYKKGYTYDDNNRLKTAALPGTSAVTYSYDWVGNRLDTGFTYNAADQLTASPGKSYTYDGNGNMLTGTMSFSYTYTNLVATAGGTSMSWDSMGNRMSFTTSSSAAYQFVYDPKAGIPAVLEEVTPGGSVFYVREPSGALICRLTGQNLTPAYYHFDELGSTLFLTDPDGILTDKYAYDAWGNVTSHTGSTSQPYQYVGELGYYNHYQESGFRLMQLGVRLYDPEIGRFTQRDPQNDEMSQYDYADGNPIFASDATGRRTDNPKQDYTRCRKDCIQSSNAKTQCGSIAASLGSAALVSGFCVVIKCNWVTAVIITFLGGYAGSQADEQMAKDCIKNSCMLFCDRQRRRGMRGDYFDPRVYDNFMAYYASFYHFPGYGSIGCPYPVQRHPMPGFGPPHPPYLP